jgi:hypothetical protein
MAARNTKPAKAVPGTPESTEKASPIQNERRNVSAEAAATSPAKAMQATSSSPPASEPRLAVTLRARNGFEYHIDMARSVAEALIDPDVPDAFIEVPGPREGIRRFLHTSEIKEIDVRGLE